MASQRSESWTLNGHYLQASEMVVPLSHGTMPKTNIVGRQQLGMLVPYEHDSRTGMGGHFFNGGLTVQVPDGRLAVSPGHIQPPGTESKFRGPGYNIFKDQSTGFQSTEPHLAPPSVSTQTGQISWQQSSLSPSFNASPSSQYPATSPFTQTVSPTPVSDSAYWSMPESGRGACPTPGGLDRESQGSPMPLRDRSTTSPPTSLDVEHPELASGYPVHECRPLRGDKGDRSRQDAHSKVEKRYRTNINNKIEQLRRILPANPALENQYGDPVDTFPGSRRRKCGTELSKRDVLSASILRLEQLELEVRQLSLENQQLKSKVAYLGSLKAKG